MINEHDIEAFKRFAPVEDLKDFQQKMDQNFVEDSIRYHYPNDLWLCWKLINEEFQELGNEFTNADKEKLKNGVVSREATANILKETVDLLYVLFFFAAGYNLPIYEAFERVHKSNLSKLGDDGKPLKNEFGKVLKGPNYKEPNLKDLV